MKCYLSKARKFVHEHWYNLVSYIHIPLVPLMQVQTEAERLATISPAAGFDEGRPSREAPRKKGCHTTSTFDIGRYNANSH